MFVALQKVLPQHGLSRLAGRIADSRHPTVRRLLIERFAAHYRVNMSEAAVPALSGYASFNDFFTRALRPDARPLAPSPDDLVSPADGTMSQFGAIRGESLLQAKRHEYAATTLLTDGALAHALTDGWFATIYLAPSDYHRVHAPFDGTLVRTIAVPGALFSVNAQTDAGIRGLFCRNERLVMVFDTRFGPAAVVMVGALIVASIETPFDTPVSPYERLTTTQHDVAVARGDEIGRFLLGSTVIVLLPQGAIEASKELAAGNAVRMGESLGKLTPARS